ncbi:proton-coupled folate transporter-like [Melanaphis sacchari]|uniref:Proton-coupled folate transporter n=1 Tax=Melanaphis sacchari TaxID=742174 RepID=A0A2H8TW54_9HEMI|nr:proton-coupled folate transporter-like [Melanaphis sacchari]
MDFYVEIVTLLYSASLAMSAFFQNNLLLRKACNSSVPFGECTDGEANAQHVVSTIYSWKAGVQYTIPIVLIMLAGPWSDSHGRRRKPLILLPLIGQILTDSLCILNVYFWNWSPQIAAIFEAITPGLFGARNMFWVGVISYISDNCTNESRTLKYGIINAIYTISTLIGTGLAGFLNIGLGFYGAFLVPISLNLIAFMVSSIFIKDTSKPYDKNVVWLKPKHFMQNYLSVFKGGDKNYSITLFALLMCQAVLVGRIGGEYAVTYLFMRYKFKWYEVQYSYFAAYKMLTIFVGTLFSVTVLSYRLKLNDAIIGYIACTFDILAAVCYVLVYEPWQLYLIPMVDFFHGTALTISTSLTSKIVDNEKLGRLNSVQALMSTIMSFVVVSIYSATYNLTFEYLPGAVFLLNIILTFPLLIIFMIIYCKCKYMWTPKEITQS